MSKTLATVAEIPFKANQAWQAFSARAPRIALLLIPGFALAAASGATLPPTGQRTCHGSSGESIPCQQRDGYLPGQDAAYARGVLRYRDNGDGTLTDLNTGLVWQQSTGEKITWKEARQGAAKLDLAGHRDWRLPTLRELYSLIDFSGASPAPGQSGRPFIDTAFAFRYGDVARGERPIDAQYWSATAYTGLAMQRGDHVFGVNFADGRIKAYPTTLPPRGEKHMFVRYVRGNPAYDRNDFVDNGDDTVTDRATGLMWMRIDSGHMHAGPFNDGRMNWPEALTWATTVNHAGHADWRLPNAKELQSLVDYRRSPHATASPAISPLFATSAIRDETGAGSYPYYWSSTTHLDGPWPGSAAVYVAFGEAPGYMHLPASGASPRYMDVHGAGAQRSDPKTGNPAAFPFGRGPQGDVLRIYNMVRLVRTVAPGK
jgi:hypothetical protein